MTIYRVESSPFAEDAELPWDYDEDGFVNWVDEVFFEGYKRDTRRPTVGSCLGILEAAGYKIAVLEEV